VADIRCSPEACTGAALDGHRVEGHRQRNVNDAQTFAKSVNESVLPPFLSVVFDPTRRKIGGADGVRRDSARTRATSSANTNGLPR
jgi:hypothetical protein